MNSRLTLDYGLRFTHQQPQYDANGQASNFFLDKYDRGGRAGAVPPGCPGSVFPCETTRQAMNPADRRADGRGHRRR